MGSYYFHGPACELTACGLFHDTLQSIFRNIYVGAVGSNSHCRIVISQPCGYCRLFISWTVRVRRGDLASTLSLRNVCFLSTTVVFHGAARISTILHANHRSRSPSSTEVVSSYSQPYVTRQSMYQRSAIVQSGPIGTSCFPVICISE